MQGLLSGVVKALSVPAGGIKDFVAALWSTLVELADSKKAILTFVLAASTLAVTAYPDLAKYQDVVYNRIDVALGLLVLLIGLIDGIKAAHAARQGAG